MKPDLKKTIGWAVNEANSAKRAGQRALEQGSTGKAEYLQFVEARWWKVVEALRLLQTKEGKS